MEPIVVKSNGEKLDGKKVRYINYKNEDYIIYTLEEVDKENYQKLYINKIVDNEEETITDIEWEDLKKEIPNIVKEIKNNNMIDVTDLDIDSIDNIDMKYSRAFKLKEKIVKSIIKQKTIDTIKQIDEDLKSIMAEVDDIENKDTEADENSKENNESEIPDIETPVNPKEDKDENDSEEQKDLETKVAELEEKVKKYEEIIEKIKIMIDES